MVDVTIKQNVLFNTTYVYFYTKIIVNFVRYVMSDTKTLMNAFNPEIIFVAENTYPALPREYIESNTHKHECIQISVILSGEIHYIIEGEPYLLKKGDIVILKPGTPHSTIIPPHTKCSDIHIGLHLYGFSKWLSLESPIITLTKEPETFYECALEIAYERRHHKLDYPFMLKALIMRLLVMLHRELSSQDTQEETDDVPCTPIEKKEVVDFITRYISNHYMNDITLDMFSRDMYLSQAYISKIFKEETGSSPINYLIKTRLAKAKNLLQNENLPIKIVAKQVGYDDVYHFSKLFKKYYGLPPSKLYKKSS